MRPAPPTAARSPNYAKTGAKKASGVSLYTRAAGLRVACIPTRTSTTRTRTSTRPRAAPPRCLRVSRVPSGHGAGYYSSTVQARDRPL